MKKYIFTLFIGLYLFNPIAIVSQEYEDLLALLVDEKYEKCYDKAMKYTLKDKTKKDPLPYLYVSQALNEMSQINKYKDVFPKAYMQSLQYATKYRKKDKSYAYKEDAEPYLEKLKEVILEEIENYVLIGDERSFKKAKSLAKKVIGFDPNCRGAKFMRGYFEVLTKNKTEGKKMIAAAYEEVKKIGDDVQFGDLTLTQQKYLKFSIIFAAKITREKDLSKAREIISVGQPYFGEDREDCLIEDNSDFKEVYKDITG